MKRLCVLLLLSCPHCKVTVKPAVRPFRIYAADGTQLAVCMMDEIGNVSDCGLMQGVKLDSLVQMMVDAPKNPRMAKVLRVRKELP